MKTKFVLAIKKLMRIIYRLFYVIDCVLLAIMKLFGLVLGKKDIALDLLLPFCEAAEKMSDCYVTCKFRPKKSTDIVTDLYGSENHLNKVAIIMQGPIVEKNNFTLETIRMYKKLFPGVLVIVSTWEGENVEQIFLMEQEENCRVVKCQRPRYGGNLNINFQVVTTLAGLRYAKELGIEYALKIRSDIRLSRASIINEMMSMIDENPCIDYMNIGQKKRLLIFNAYVLRPYNFSDFYGFGDIDDMIEYWNTDLQDCTSEPGYVVANRMLQEKWSYRRVFESGMGPEIEIPKNYIVRKKGRVECDLEDYWRVIRGYFITLPHAYLDALWYKYDYNREENYIQGTYVREIYGGMREGIYTFSYGMWLDLYKNKFQLNAVELQHYVDELA